MHYRKSLTAIFLSFWVSAATLPAQAVPVSEAEGASCNAALATVRSRLAQVKDVSVTHVDQFNRANLYSDFPPGRPMSYSFRLKGRGAETVMHSPKLLMKLSQRLMTNCASVGAVQYGVDETDWYTTFGLMPNGKIMAFACVDPAPGLKLKWGYQICL